VKNVAVDVANSIRGKHIDQLEKYIAGARKHDFFDLKDTGFGKHMNYVADFELPWKEHFANRS
jgi:hypothetical protein